MNYIVFDLEATCWQDRSVQPNEIIEIGAVKVNEHGQITSEFSQFVRPKVHPILSDFCTELTSIRQSDVVDAPHFPEALQRFHEWIDADVERQNQPIPKGNKTKRTADYWLCSWGFYDRKQLKLDCDLHGLPTGWLRHHISVKHQHASLHGLRRPMGMANALKLEGLTLEGTHHRGIDDARNISKIFIKHLDLWKAP